MQRIKFEINGIQHSVGSEVSSDMSLVDFIRERAELRGTKYMCRQGGCGACVVGVSRGGDAPVAVNSCLVSITSCQDWKVTTVEAIGNKLAGYHPLQTTLAENSGTQCGHCTPGWIMAMHSLTKSKKPTMLEIENYFSSNVCRCTGYRPILDAFKKFASDSPQREILDIEDLSICKKTCERKCDIDDWCLVSEDDIEIVKINLKDGKIWYRARNFDDVFVILEQESKDSYMLVAGNTAKGVYPIDEYPYLLIDISGIPELKGHELDQNLIIGAGNTITEMLDILRNMAKQEYFEYLQQLYDHLREIANTSVRNIATIGGNLMVKHEHNFFPSDIYLLLESVGAYVTILSSTKHEIKVSMQQFLKQNMNKMLILNMILPPLTLNHRLVTFRVSRKSQNAPAVTNAAFLFKLSDDNKVVESRIVYGGLSPSFNRAYITEKELIAKMLFKNDTLQSAIGVLKEELHVIDNPPQPSAAYRKQLAINLFYKGLLSLCPDHMKSPRYESGATKIHKERPVSKGRQIYDTDSSLWPLNQPIPKKEALLQCSGEAMYVDDVPYIPREVFAELVLSTVPTGKLERIDPSRALKEPGVIEFYSAKDIPGINSFSPKGYANYPENEEVFCSGEVKCFYQPIGLVVGETRAIAERAAKLVNVVYKNVNNNPVIDIKEAKEDSKRNQLFRAIDATDRGRDIKRVIQGHNTIRGQYHFVMETLVCATKPIEEGLEIYASTHHPDGIHGSVSRALKLNQSRINVITNRVGGSYGLKVSRATLGAVACSLVTKMLNRPCRLIQSMPNVTKCVGKRLPSHVDYEIAVNDSGIIQYLNYNIYEDNGYKYNEPLSNLIISVVNNCYSGARWDVKIYDTITDTAKNSWCRSPGTLEAISNSEWMMERIAYELNLNPIEVRLANLDPEHNDLREMVDTLKMNGQYEDRRSEVDQFNKRNRWKKRGLRMSLMKWPAPEMVLQLNVNLSVYQNDGSVVITHGGIELGQGINMKAIQICAYLLKIPYETIEVKANNSIYCPNSAETAGSLASQNVGIGVRRCCETLLNRLEPIRKELDNPTWQELVSTAYKKGVDLQTHGGLEATDKQNYVVYGVILAEVEVDILTGECEILRVDLLQDVGQSVNPYVDIGQIEGAFMMGQGYWTCEELVYGARGDILTVSPWNYHVPQARDIPQDFRVYFRENSYSDGAMFGAKATGEPSICLSVAVAMAIREAMTSAREEAGHPTTEWFQIDGPYTTEKICMNSGIKIEDLKLI